MASDTESDSHLRLQPQRRPHFLNFIGAFLAYLNSMPADYQEEVIADSEEEEDIYAPLGTTHETSESMNSVW